MNILYANLYDIVTNNIDNINHIKNSYMELLQMLTSAENIDSYIFITNLQKINNLGIVWIAYINSPRSIDFKIIGTGTVIIEPKLIHSGKSVAHIEDIVVHNDYRNLGIAKNILNTLKGYSQTNNCYKIILDCNESVKSVYEKSNFNVKGLQMAYYF